MHYTKRRKIVAANILAGNSYRDIAYGLGVSKSTIGNDFKAILDEWRQHYQDDIDDWMQVQLRRLDTLLNAIWDKAKSGDLQAMDRALKIMERQNKLLGLDAPIDVNVRGVVASTTLTADDMAEARDAVLAFEEALLHGDAATEPPTESADDTAG